MFGIEVFPEHQLSREGSPRPLLRENLVVLLGPPASIGPHHQGVLLCRQLDRSGVHTRQIEVD
jgi:hypothetical protein